MERRRGTLEFQREVYLKIQENKLKACSIVKRVLIYQYEESWNESSYSKQPHGPESP
jgi:hypothetical protein